MLARVWLPGRVHLACAPNELRRNWTNGKSDSSALARNKRHSGPDRSQGRAITFSVH